MKPREYRFNNSCLTIILDDILESKAEVIVSSDDNQISMGGGVSLSIYNKGGSNIQADARRKLPASVGDVVVSTAGNLEHQKYVFHCLTLDFQQHSDAQLSQNEDLQKYIIQHSIDKCFILLHALDINSIAFPCIGTGFAHFSIQKVAEIMADSISKNLGKTHKHFNVELYLYDKCNTRNEMDYIDVFEHFAVQSALTKQRFMAIEGTLGNEYDVSNAQGHRIPQANEMKHQVFISYARKDADKVNAIRKILDENSIDYWIDKDGIFSGENYKEVIVDAIDCAKVVIFVSSINSNNSVNVIRELGYAVSQRKTIIPIIIDEAQYAKSIRLDIADIDQIDFTNDSLGTSKLISSLIYALQVK